MTKLSQCGETVRQGSTYMGGGAKITVDVDAQVVDNTGSTEAPATVIGQ